MVGTRAIEDMRWLEALADRFPGQLIVAADVRDRRIVTRGWLRTLPLGILDAIEELNVLPLAGILVTAVHREGQLLGTDLPLMEDVAEGSHLPRLRGRRDREPRRSTRAGRLRCRGRGHRHGALYRYDRPAHCRGGVRRMRTNVRTNVRTNMSKIA